MSMLFLPAEPKDGERILEILESSPAKGSIELLYTRRPDAYASYKKESGEALVWVARDGDRIVGSAAEISRRVYIGGEDKKAAYICGLKKDAEYGGNVRWGAAFFKSLAQADADCYFCSVVSDNKEMQRVFEKKRKKTANTEFLTDYTTYMLAPYFKFKLKADGYSFRRAGREDESALLGFLNSEGRKKELFPVIDSLGQFTDLTADDFFILEKDGAVVCAGALWDQSGYRQYIVKKYRGIMKCARLFNPILRLLGYIELPREGENISFPMLSFFLAKDDDEEHYKAFLNFISREIAKKYRMFVIGTPSSYFANDIYKKLRNIHFDTKIYSVDLILGEGRRQKIDRSKIWLECGLL